MKKWTMPLVMLLTLALLVGLAFLPAAVGAIGEAGAVNTPETASLHSIAPYVGDKGSGLTIPQKASALIHGDVSGVVPALAAMTEADVQNAVSEQLQAYTDGGILPQLQKMQLQCQPMIAVSWQDPSHYLLYWSVTITAVGEEQGKHLVTVMIDDETGLLLSMDYMGSGAAGFSDAAPVAAAFGRIWLEQNGISDAAVLGDTGQSVASSDFAKCGYLLEDEKTPLYVFFVADSSGSFCMWFSNMP